MNDTAIMDDETVADDGAASGNVTIIDKARIMSILPHSDPFLFLNQVEILEPGIKGQCDLTVSNISEQVLESPKLMRADLKIELILETAAQLCGVVLATQPNANAEKGGKKLLLGFDAVEIKSHFEIDQSLRLCAEILSDFSDMYQCEFKVYQADLEILSGKLNVLNGEA